MKRLWLLGLAIGLGGCSGCNTAPTVIVHGVPNLRIVDAQALRGGQPNQEGWDYLDRTSSPYFVIKLNEDKEGTDNTSNSIIRLPISLPEQLGLEKIQHSPADLVNLIAHSNLRTNVFYIHCEHGQDRTGLFCAIWRVEMDGWSVEDAEKEMLADGFHKELLGLWNYWLEYKKSKTK